MRLVRITIAYFLSASGCNKGKNKLLVTRAGIAMPDHMSLGFIPNSGQPLGLGGKVGTESK